MTQLWAQPHINVVCRAAPCIAVILLTIVHHRHVPAGTRLEELCLTSFSNSYHFLRLVGAALPSSLTKLQLQMVQVVDTPVMPPDRFEAAMQAYEQGFPWQAPPLQLPHLKQLRLAHVSAWMPAAAFRCGSSHVSPDNSSVMPD